MNNDEIREKIKMLETVLEFHSTQRVLTDDKEYENHINDILDEISKLREMLND